MGAGRESGQSLEEVVLSESCVGRGEGGVCTSGCVVSVDVCWGAQGCTASLHVALAAHVTSLNLCFFICQ